MQWAVCRKPAALFLAVSLAGPFPPHREAVHLAFWGMKVFIILPYYYWQEQFTQIRIYWYAISSFSLPAVSVNLRGFWDRQYCLAIPKCPWLLWFRCLSVGLSSPILLPDTFPVGCAHCLDEGSRQGRDQCSPGPSLAGVEKDFGALLFGVVAIAAVVVPDHWWVLYGWCVEN